jgi:hypothetical protein
MGGRSRFRGAGGKRRVFVFRVQNLKIVGLRTADGPAENRREWDVIIDNQRLNGATRKSMMAMVKAAEANVRSDFTKAGDSFLIR